MHVLYVVYESWDATVVRAQLQELVLSYHNCRILGIKCETSGLTAGTH